ncbi:MAG TPA: HAD-IIIA family hydrolase [Terriglobales bacterium]|nr:HAD-IIIA family hydrolase [Terriglobales bacterium]
MSNTPAVFLDRDGVINRLIYHKEADIVDSPFTAAQFQVFPCVPKAIRLLNQLGLPVVIVSNQPGIAKQHFNAEVLGEFEKRLQAALTPSAAHVDATYYCLHHPDASVKALRTRCSCRKPGIGMLTQAARDLDLSPEHSYMVGDGLTDVEAGNRAACKTIFVGRWKCEHCQFIRPLGLRPTFVAKDLLEAARLIQQDVQGDTRKSARTIRKPGQQHTLQACY